MKNIITSAIKSVFTRNNNATNDNTTNTTSKFEEFENLGSNEKKPFSLTKFEVEAATQGDALSMVTKKMDWTAKDDQGRTPMMLAVHEDSNLAALAVIACVAKYHPEARDLQDNNGQTALMKAARYNHISAVKFLLNNKAELDVVDNKDRTALHYAVLHCNAEIVKMLVKAGASTSVPAEWNEAFMKLIRK